MKSGQNPISDFELQAYVDDELDSVRRAEIEHYLHQHPELADETRSYQRYNQGLQELFNPVLEEKVAARLLSEIKPGKTFMPRAQVASVLIAIVTGLIIGWVSRGGLQPDNKIASQQSPSLVQDAFDYHAVYTPEVRHPVEVTAEQETHLVKWLSKRLNTEVKAPALNTLGFDLLGGRLLSSDGEPAAQFMYENSEGQRLTLFTRHREDSEVETAFRYASKNGINGFYWIDRDLSFVLLGNLSKSDISSVAHTVYEVFNL